MPSPPTYWCMTSTGFNRVEEGWRQYGHNYYGDDDDDDDEGGSE